MNTRASDCGKTVFETKLILKVLNNFGKINTYSPSLHQNCCQKLFKGFGSFIPKYLIQNILNEESIDLKIEELNKGNGFEKSNEQAETYEPMEESKNAQENEGGMFVLDASKEKETNIHRVQEMIKFSRHNIKTLFMISRS